jgi:hypothetical protein
MERFLLALVAGMLGGAVGALAVDLIGGRTASSTGDPAPTPAGLTADLRELAERMARIERALPAETAPEARLQGRPDDPVTAEAAALAANEAAEAQLQRIEERVTAAAERAFAKLEERREKPAPAPDRKKRMTLAEVSAEIGLSREEESEIRRIYEETGEKLLKVLAEPDGDVEAVKRDLEAAAKTERGRNVVMMKYLPKILPKIGDVLSIQADRESRVAATLGPERAERYERFDVVEADPYGFGGNVRMEARGR